MKRLSVFLLAIILIIISIGFIIINGRTYTVKFEDIAYINSIDELNIKIEDKIVKCIDKKLENDVISLKFESILEGKTYVSLCDKNDNDIKFFSIYVHKYGVITYNSYFGDSTGSIIIPISIAIWIAYILFLAINKYKKELNKNMYQYKNITYVGLIIFLFFTFINQLVSIANYQGLIYTIEEAIRLCSVFSMYLLPIAFILSIFITISNIVLVKKEGLNIKNLLGLILSIFFCFTTILPDLLNNILQTATWIDVHNERKIALYIQDFIEVAISTVVSYLECILIGTVILGLKSAKHIPKFNKDFIIILGCQIKKDGTLTNLLKGRVDRAIEFSKLQKEQTGKDLVFIPSGGQGKDEIISEAQAMKNYLVEQGISENNIIIEDKSNNTYENIKFSTDIIKNKMTNAKIAFSTTNYHVYRAGEIANEQGINAEGIGAKTKSYFWINAFIREFIATLFSERKKHIIIICSLMIVSIFLIMMLYLSNLI